MTLGTVHDPYDFPSVRPPPPGRTQDPSKVRITSSFPGGSLCPDFFHNLKSPFHQDSRVVSVLTRDLTLCTASTPVCLSRHP